MLGVTRRDAKLHRKGCWIRLAMLVIGVAHFLMNQHLVGLSAS